MSRTGFFLATLAVMLFGIGMYGCTTSQPSNATSTPADGSGTRDDAQMDHDDHSDHGEHEHGGDAAMSDMDKMKDALAKLPEADRAAAEKQHFCPVSGEMLGTMGLPIKETVQGQDVWLCCEGCKDKLLENPDEYLAKLNQ